MSNVGIESSLKFVKFVKEGIQLLGLVQGAMPIICEIIIRHKGTMSYTMMTTRMRHTWEDIQCLGLVQGATSHRIIILHNALVRQQLMMIHIKEILSLTHLHHIIMVAAINVTTIKGVTIQEGIQLLPLILMIWLGIMWA